MGDECKEEELPPYDFIARWQRFEELNQKEITEVMKNSSFYNPAHQAAIQVYDTYANERDAERFAENNSQSIGIDIIVAKTNSWIVLKDNEQTLELTKYPGDENRIVEGILHNMKEEQKIGESMIKKRINMKKEEHPEQFKDIDSDASKVLAPI